jgi:hypothetical protein
MNDRYFACPRCKVYTNAGNRWAYLTLEGLGVVTRGEPVPIDAVLADQDYWRPDDSVQGRWIPDEVLPAVRSFLERCRDHGVIYIQTDDLPTLGAVVRNPAGGYTHTWVEQTLKDLL